MLTLAEVLCFHFLFRFSSSIPVPNTFGWYLIVPLRNWSAAHCLYHQLFESSVNGVHELPVTSHCSDYMKRCLKCLVCVTQIVKLSDLMIPLNLKSVDCSLTLHINILRVLCIQLSNIESLACHVLVMLDFHWSQGENVAHGFWGNFFFIVMWDLSCLCQKSVDVISLASALNQG